MRKTTPLWLIGLIVSLALVGLVSHTPIRHAIQISPCLLALVLLWRGPAWARASALPVFVFWFVLMTFIWLFLLGIARILSGQFTPVEIALTISIGVCCLGGGREAVRGMRGLAVVPVTAVFLGFLVLQAAALSLSMQPQFARI